MQARADAAEAEVQQLLDVVPQRDALKDQVATLQHALNDMQTTTGAVDIREVLQRYQARELISEQVQEQLRTRIEQLETQEAELHGHVDTLKTQNKVYCMPLLHFHCYISLPTCSATCETIAA
jgi:Type IV secretion system proteins